MSIIVAFRKKVWNISETVRADKTNISLDILHKNDEVYVKWSAYTMI